MYGKTCVKGRTSPQHKAKNVRISYGCRPFVSKPELYAQIEMNSIFNQNYCIFEDKYLN